MKNSRYPKLYKLIWLLRMSLHYIDFSFTYMPNLSDDPGILAQ